MSRGQGFATADIDTGLFVDPKVKALWRQLRDEAAMNTAIVLYQAVIYESWGAGERLTAEDAAPVWIPDIEAPTAVLQEADRLDSEGRIPDHAWASWFGQANDRREALREKWRRAAGKRRSATRAGSAVDPTKNPRGLSGGSADPVPSRTVSSVPSLTSPTAIDAYYQLTTRTCRGRRSSG